jgi:hypothetical protein
MNRAWIPAGALAGVSVAGLLALAPLTDSLGTKVEFAPIVPVSPSLTKPLHVSVPVSVNLQTVGSVTTSAALKTRGGAAKSNTGSDTGTVAVRIRPNTSSPATETKAAAKTVTQAPTESAIKPKKTPARPKSIGGTSGANGDAGLTGGNTGTTGVGEQSNTPGG